eukprot:2241252-Rhodomonas_salina.7
MYCATIPVLITCGLLPGGSWQRLSCVELCVGSTCPSVLRAAYARSGTDVGCAGTGDVICVTSEQAAG